MTQIIVLIPLVAVGGLVGFFQERIRRRRLAARLSSDTAQEAADVEISSPDLEIPDYSDSVQIRYSERAAHIALGVATAGALFYPLLGLAATPIIGYSAFHWLRARYPSEPPQQLSSPSTVLVLIALGASLATGHWVLASLVLTVDLAARKRAAQRAQPKTVQARSALARRSMSLRVALLLLTNLAVLLLLSVVLAMFGVAPSSLLALALLAFGFGMIGSFISLALSKWIAKFSTGARVIDQPESEVERWLVDVVAHHAARAGVGMPDVAIFDSRDMNAFATGMNRDHALVAVSTALLARMTPAEIEAVLGHEMTHVANGDMVTLTLIQGVLDTFVIFISRIVAGLIDGLAGGRREGGGLGTLGYWVVVIVLQLTLGLLATMIVMWFSRQRELRADAGGADLAGCEDMISALERLQIESGPSQLPHRLAALGIHSSPSRLSRLFSSHPPIEERIAALWTGPCQVVPEDLPPDNEIEAMP